MTSIIPMVKAVDFIETNLREEISVANIAEAVSHSVFHFCRTFNSVVHITPYNYLMRRRLTESALELIKDGKKIGEVAFDYRFNNPETYSRAFRRMFGLLPNQLKERGRLDSRQLMPRASYDYLSHINSGTCLQPVLKEKGTIKVAGYSTLLKEKMDIPAFWSAFEGELQALKDKFGADYYYCITDYPDDWERRGFFFLTGVEIDPQQPVESFLLEKKLPAYNYARFIHRGSYNKLEFTLGYIYHTWLPRTGRTLSPLPEISCYGQAFKGFDNEESESEIFIPL